MASQSDQAEPHNGPLPRTRRRKLIKFLPNRPVLLVSSKGTVALPQKEISPERIGWKAFGLSAVPKEWAPIFLVVDGESLTLERNDTALQEHVRLALTALGLSDNRVFVRSSAISETIEDRGKFDSEVCTGAEVVATIRQLSHRLSANVEKVHWIVQRYIPPARKGHLSNERQMSLDPRDWVGEFELQGDLPGYTFPIAVRHWRDGSHVTDFDLSANSETAVTHKLKPVALWGTGLDTRVHFEWIWSGTELWIVQADLARPGVGINPNQLLPAAIPEILVQSLELFRLAGGTDYQRYSKLRNAQTYKELGYEMPQFFILDNAEVILQLLRGEMSELLKRDLQELTKRAVIIRTDGTGIPKEKREMLPRSDNLCNFEQARSWLTGKFGPEIKRVGLADLPLCLIAHHFIPSAAAAWARAEPNGRTVRIESLWGVPDGLYWHSHDTFEVRLGGSKKDYRYRERLRFKRTFVAPDKDGKWRHFHPIAPFDWVSSLREKDWILEIAETTQRVADYEQRPTTVMWFIDNHSQATPHRVLPWFHCDSAIGTPKAAPRRKFTMASDFTIGTLTDWNRLQSLVRAGNRIERVILDLKDPELVRNREFAQQLAEFVAANKIVVELAGGILSHAYYMLQRHGAQVECVDLFGADEETVEYNKLVRDKIPEQIQSKGESVEVVRLRGEALLTSLRQKLVEESFEAADTKSFDELVAELADVLEVVNGICDALHIPLEQVILEQQGKSEHRGGFHEGLMLKTTSTPHSLTAKPASLDQDLSLNAPLSMRLIERSEKMPTSPAYSRPDFRSVNDQPEAVLTFETELSRIREAKQNAVFELQIGQDDTRTFRLSVEVTRNRSVLWSQVRVRLEPTQLEMKLGSDSQLKLWSDDSPSTSSDSHSGPE
jgi:predicted house-cleaning noncanonical NTP pyrophosphatase (MazG superfamily)